MTNFHTGIIELGEEASTEAQTWRKGSVSKPNKKVTQGVESLAHAHVTSLLILVYTYVYYMFY
jgi:hypothetical protein